MHFRKTVLTPFLFLAFFAISYQSAGQILWADSCRSTSFTGSLLPGPGLFSEFKSVHEYSNGDLAVAGFLRRAGSPAPSTFAFASRMSASGVVLWTKYIGDTAVGNFTDTRVYSSVLTNNGDLLIQTNTYNNPNGGPDLIRFDGNGNLIWKKRLPIFTFNAIFQDIIETSDGGFLMGGVAMTNNGIILKLNNQGNMIWSKSFFNNVYVNCRSIAESPSGYYFTGYTYQFNFSSTENLLAKLDKNTGDTLWTKGFGEATAAQGLTEYGFDRIVYKSGLLYLQGSTSVNYTGLNKPSSIEVIFNESGIITDTKRVENAEVRMDRSALFRGRFFDHNTRTGVQFNRSDTSDFYVFRLDGQNNPMWAWKLPYTGIEVASDFIVSKDLSLIVSGVLPVYNPIFLERAILKRIHPNGKLIGCSNLPVAITVSSPLIQTSGIAIQMLSNTAGAVTMSPIAVFYDFPFTWVLDCTSQANCYISKIEGSNIVCTGNSQIYKIRRKGQCAAPVTFYSSSPDVQISVLSDTSVNIIFNGSGAKKIFTSQMSTCGLLYDSVTVDVIAASGPVNLGIDRFLCGTALSIPAGGNFQSYVWSNGSSDSVINVALPGIYHVTVTDYCNVISSDTIEIFSVQQIDYNIGSDTTICKGDTLKVKAPGNFNNYQWRNAYNMLIDNDSTVRVFPSIDTFYISTAEKYTGCVVSDTIHITIKTGGVLVAGADTLICSNQTLLLNATSGFTNYLWNTGSTGPVLSVQQSGNYSVVATNSNGCKSRDTVNVTVENTPDPQISPFTNICENVPRLLSMPNSYATYLWQDNSTQATYSATDTGWYHVEVLSDKGCRGKDSVYLKSFVPMPSGFLIGDSIICPYENTILRSNSAFARYTWVNGSSQPTLTVNQQGMYWLEVEDGNGCIAKDTLTVGYDMCSQVLSFPTAFSPNQDGLNDLFAPKVWGDLENYSLVIFNRYGEKVFSSVSLSAGWNGNLLGVKQETGSFVYICNYKFKNEPLKQLKGYFTLVR